MSPYSSWHCESATLTSERESSFCKVIRWSRSLCCLLAHLGRAMCAPPPTAGGYKWLFFAENMALTSPFQVRLDWQVFQTPGWHQTWTMETCDVCFVFSVAYSLESMTTEGVHQVEFFLSMKLQHSGVENVTRAAVDMVSSSTWANFQLFCEFSL